MNHPNAVAGGTSGAVAVVVIAIITALGVTLNPIVAAAVTTLVVAFVLRVGHTGLHGIFGDLWTGSDGL